MEMNPLDLGHRQQRHSRPRRLVARFSYSNVVSNLVAIVQGITVSRIVGKLNKNELSLGLQLLLAAL